MRTLASGKPRRVFTARNPRSVVRTRQTSGKDEARQLRVQKKVRPSLSTAAYVYRECAAHVRPLSNGGTGSHLEKVEDRVQECTATELRNVDI